MTTASIDTHFQERINRAKTERRWGLLLSELRATEQLEQVKNTPNTELLYVIRACQADTWFKLDDFQACANLCKQCLLERLDYNLLYLMAQALQRLERPQEAYTACEKAYELAPMNERAEIKKFLGQLSYEFS